MTDGQRDQGSIIVVALVVLLIGGIAVATLTSFAVAVIRAETNRDQRESLQRDVDSTLTLVGQVARGMRQETPSTCPNSVPISSDLTIDINCSAIGSQPPVVKAGLVTTLHSSTIEAQTLPSWSGGIEQAIAGAVVINTGTLADPRVLHLPDDRLLPASESATWSTRSTTWSEYAARHDVDEHVEYPPLPPVPTFERPGSQASIGTCSIYFPGRYLGTTSLTLNGGTHYFTSGTYYFERTLTISNGARVVMGKGRHLGCTDDATAVSVGRAPRNHEVSGRGVTILLGGAARIVVQESSVLINARDEATGVSVRTISFGTSTSTIAIPVDLVKLSDGSLVSSVSHSVIPPESSTSVSYKASTLAPATSLALDIRLNGTNVETNRVSIDGQVFTPHGGLRVTSTTSAYALSLTGGIVTARLNATLPNPPMSGTSGFSIGSSLPETSGSLVRIDVVTNRGRRSFESSAIFAAKNDQWLLVGRSRRHRWTQPS